MARLFFECPHNPCACVFSFLFFLHETYRFYQIYIANNSTIGDKRITATRMASGSNDMARSRVKSLIAAVFKRRMIL